MVTLIPGDGIGPEISASVQQIFAAAKVSFLIHRVRKKGGHVIFNYNSRISWSIFIIFVPSEQE